MSKEAWVYDMLMKLSGIIFKKALIDGNFENIYNRVFEMMIEDAFIDEMNFLEILGDVGG